MKRTLIVAFFLSLPAAAQNPEKPTPDVSEVAYGPHSRNTLDLWKAKSTVPTPVVVFFHGGGFLSGSKEQLPARVLKEFLARGITVAAVNYRLTDVAAFPAPMLDGARAIQFLRWRAGDWNLDPSRFGATGGSAGGGMALWLGFHDDLADPKSADLISRQSTRLLVVAANNAQTTYDPRWIRANIGVSAERSPFFAPFYGLLPHEYDSPRAHKLYDEAAPMTYLTRDDPPVFMFYSITPRERVSPGSTEAGLHHIAFGLALKERMDSLGIEIVVRHADDYRASNREPHAPDTDRAAFMARHLQARRK